MSIRKILALLLLTSLMLNLTGCPVMMAARVAKAASEKSDSDPKKDTQNTNGAVSSTQTSTQTTTPSK